MAKQYYIRKDPAVSGPDIEWIALDGKEFYQFITSPAGRCRHFIDMDDFMIEASEAEYEQWRREKNHSDYLRSQETENSPLSLYSDLITEDGSGEEVIHNTAVSTEDRALHSLELEDLRKALEMLEPGEYRLIQALFLSSDCKTQTQLTEKLGLTQSGISRQKKRILGKLKFLVIKSEKSQQ